VLSAFAVAVVPAAVIVPPVTERKVPPVTLATGLSVEAAATVIVMLPPTTISAVAAAEEMAGTVEPIKPVAESNVESPDAAFAGATDRTPAPNAATATSAMRLKFVFVDMFFLSLVELRNFLISARRPCEIF
jgi:hypothetical protein